MTKFEQPLLAQAASEPPLPRPGHGHQPADGERPRSDMKTDPAAVVVDPHPNWLKRWRSLRTDPSESQGSAASVNAIRELQDKIAHTPAGTLEGLQAQAELISELAWNDVVASTARQLIAGIRRLRRTEPER